MPRRYTRSTDRWGTLLRVWPAVLAIALAFGRGYLDAYGPRGWVGVLLAIIGLFVAAASIGLAFFRCTRVLLSLAMGMALIYCLNQAHEAVARQALAQRGQVSDCLVRQETPQQRTVTDTHFQPGTSPGDPGTTWTSTRTEISYDYRLACHQAGPDSMTTRTSVAKPGTTIAVLWDPTGRITPRPARPGDTPAEDFRAAGLAGGAGVLLALLDAVLDATGFRVRFSGWLTARRFRRRR
ncbi:hypothetical protein AB0H88_18275 [Nonomuraea sp. NPDC050680]|uniref:hypothetical protein n=1 Tax=Nonomuraea sp. NPDC050680 TaxID=3154630 RepID=UPI0033FB670E